MFCEFLTLRISTKDLHSIVRSRRPVVVPTECPQSETMARTSDLATTTQKFRRCASVIFVLIYYLVLVSFQFYQTC